MALTRVGYPLLCALAGALAFYLLAPAPASAPDYPRVFVHREAITRLEPDTVVRWTDRIRYVLPAPTQVATAIGGATDEVRSFCRPVVLHMQGDTVTRAPRELLIRSGSLDRGWFFGTDKLALTSPTNDGDLVRSTWNTRGSVSFVVTGDSVLVRRDRWALAKQAGTFLGMLLVGEEIGRRLR